MSETVEKKIEDIIRRNRPLFKYREELNLRSDLNMDSLDAIEFLFEIETEMNIKIPEKHIDEEGLLILGNLHRYIEKRLMNPI